MRLLHFYYVFLGVVVTAFVACDINSFTGKDDSSKSGISGAASCFVSASPQEVAAGSGVTVAPESTKIWDEVSSIAIDEKVLTVNKPSLIINPTFTRTYSVVANRKDGNVQSCTLKITVTGTDELGCTLSASPASVTKGTSTSVSATLQILGTADIVKTMIDGQDLVSEIGGSRTFELSAAKVLVGRVDASDGTYATCSFSVTEVGVLTTPGDCTKVEPDSTDIAKFNEVQTGLNAENEAALATLEAEAKPGDGFTALDVAEYAAEGITKSNFVQFDAQDCRLLASGLGPVTGNATCSQSERHEVSDGLAYVYLELDDRHYDVYIPTKYNYHFTFYKDGGGKVLPVIVNKIQVSSATVDVTLCKCDPSANGLDSDSAGSMAHPPSLFIERAEAPDASYKGEKLWNFEEKRAYFKKTFIELEPGKSKPACPIQHHVDT